MAGDDSAAGCSCLWGVISTRIDREGTNRTIILVDEVAMDHLLAKSPKKDLPPKTLIDHTRDVLAAVAALFGREGKPPPRAIVAPILRPVGIGFPPVPPPSSCGGGGPRLGEGQ